MDHSDYLDIADIVGQYVKLTPEGTAHYLGKCPFCSAAEDSLILSKETQYWHCLSCGENGDRYDFVAKMEKISRAEAILMIGHHTMSGEAFPHAIFKPARPTGKAAEPRPERPAARAPAPSAAVEKGLSAIFQEFRNIIPSYQGAAILDDRSRLLLSDTGFSFSAELAGVGENLATILVHAATLFSKWGGKASVPATLTFASENLAILVHKFGPADKLIVLVVRLGDPGDVFAARRLAGSASAKLK